MENRQLHYFVTVAELGSVAAASRTLHIAQPAITRQIKNLEESLGISLFERHARGMILTSAGRKFYQDAIDILNAIERAKSQAVKADQGDIGYLKIGITPQHIWLTEVQQHLSEFRKHHPEISLNICTMHSRKQIMALRNGELDAGFMFIRPQDDNDFIGRFLYKESMLLAVNKNSPFADHPPQKIDELRSEPFIWSPENQAFDLYKMIIDELRRHDFTPKIDHEGCDYNSMLSLVSAGQGYTFVPAVAKYLKVYDVVMHELPELSVTFDLELVWRRDNPNPCLPHFTKNYNHQMRRLT